MGHPETGRGGAATPKETARHAAAALTSPAGQRLVAQLRRTKHVSGLSFARLAARTHYSKASLERYVNGKLFPNRDAVQEIARACGAEPRELLRLWDDALEAGLDRRQGERRRVERSDASVQAAGAAVAAAEPAAAHQRSPAAPEPTDAGPPGRTLRARFRSRPRMVTGAAVVLSAALALAVPSPLGRVSATHGPTTGCRDYDANLHAYTAGKMCWHAAEATVNGYVRNPDGPGKAVVQLCLSDRPNICGRTIDLAAADPGRTARYRRTVNLRSGYGAWVRTCSDHLCTQWQ